MNSLFILQSPFSPQISQAVSIFHGPATTALSLSSLCVKHCGFPPKLLAANYLGMGHLGLELLREISRRPCYECLKIVEVWLCIPPSYCVFSNWENDKNAMEQKWGPYFQTHNRICLYIYIYTCYIWWLLMVNPWFPAVCLSLQENILSPYAQFHFAT